MIDGYDTYLPIEIRPMVSADYNYVSNSFIKSFHTTEVTRHMSNADYFPWQTARINWCIGNTLVLVAYLEDQPDAIVGYMIAQKLGDDLLLHWLNVKGAFRRFGVAKKLLTQFQPYQNILCTHYFELFPKLKYKYNLVYKPLLVPTNG